MEQLVYHVKERVSASGGVAHPDVEHGLFATMDIAQAYCRTMTPPAPGIINLPDTNRFGEYTYGNFIVRPVVVFSTYKEAARHATAAEDLRGYLASAPAAVQAAAVALGFGACSPSTF